MKKSETFELFDEILKESTVEETDAELEEIEDEIDDEAEASDEVNDEVFTDVDDVWKEAFRANFKDAIYESRRNDEERIKLLESVETAEIDDRNLLEFVLSTAEPILEMSGVFNEGFTGRERQVPLPVYDTALVLAANLSENLEVLDESELESELEEIFEMYDIPNELDEVLVYEAMDALLGYGLGGFMPSVEDLSEAVLEWNTVNDMSLSEAINQYHYIPVVTPFAYLFNEAATPSKKSGNQAGRGKIKRAGDYITQKAGMAWTKIKDAGSRVKKGVSTHGGAFASKFGRKTKIAAGVTTGLAAVTAIAATVYKKKNAECAGLSGTSKWSCKLKAAQKALATAKVAKKACKDSRTPDRCAKATDKLIKKWEGRVAKYKGRVQG